MDFYKYQAAGNDFVLVTSLESRADISADEVIRLCDRRYGIGADGLIIMESSADYDFSMRFFNNDGSSGMWPRGRTADGYSRLRTAYTPAGLSHLRAIRA